MKISEVEMVNHQSDHGIKTFDMFKGAKQYGNAYVGDSPLLHVESGGVQYFCLKDIAYLVGNSNTYDGRPCIEISRTWVEQSHRNKGIMKSMYLALKSLGIVVVSDKQLSPESLKIWKWLCSNGHAFLVDFSSNELRRAVDSDFTVENSKTRFIIP